MLKCLLLAAGMLVSGSALADDGSGLGSLLRGQISQSGTGTPAGTDWVKLFRGQNGDPVFATVGSLGGAGSITVGTTPITGGAAGNLLYTDGTNIQASTGLTVSGTGKITTTGGLSVSLTTPASQTATCTAGTIAWDATYIYVCTASNHWKRALLDDTAF